MISAKHIINLPLCVCRRIWNVRPLRRLIKAGAIAAILTALLTAGINAWVILVTKTDCYPSAARVPATKPGEQSYQAAIVLGARVWKSGRPSLVLRDRLATALELYRLGRVPKIIVSGDHGRNDYDEVNIMAAWLVAAGVPQEDVFLDHAGFDTYDTMMRAAKIFGLKRALVVTQGFHLPRAVYLARRAGIEACGVRADYRQYQGTIWNETRESLARVKCVLESLIQRDPKYLGPTIAIEGDGRTTWDNQTESLFSSAAGFSAE